MRKNFTVNDKISIETNKLKASNLIGLDTDLILKEDDVIILSEGTSNDYYVSIMHKDIQNEQLFDIMYGIYNDGSDKKRSAIYRNYASMIAGDE